MKAVRRKTTKINTPAYVIIMRNDLLFDTHKNDAITLKID